MPLYSSVSCSSALCRDEDDTYPTRKIAAMTTKRDREPTDMHLSLAIAFYTPSSVIPDYSDKQLTTTVHLHCHDISSPHASYMGSVHKNIASPSPLALAKPRHRRIPLPSQAESDITTVVHPLLQPSRGSMLMELDFARNLSIVRVLRHQGCMKEVATTPPLPSLAIVHPKLPWPIVIQRSGDREWIAVADVVETLWHALQIRDPTRLPSAPSSSSLLNNQKDAHCDV